MNCREWEERIALYVSDDLPAAEISAVQEHLGSCPNCTAFFNALQQDQRGLRFAPPEAATLDYAAMRGRIRHQIAGEQRRRKLLPALALAAAVLVAVVIWSTHRKEAPALVVTKPVPAAPSVAPKQPVQATVLPTVQPPPIRRHHGVPASQPVPQPNPKLEAMLREFIASEKKPAPKPGPASQVGMRIPSRDPNVVMIVFQPTEGTNQ